MRKLLLLLIPIMLLSCTCDGLDESLQAFTFDRVFMNECDRYTFVMPDGTIKEIWANGCHKVRLLYDVPEEKDMFVEYRSYCSGGTAFYKDLRIHVHSIKDISGGGWDHGKFGKGQTNLIE